MYNALTIGVYGMIESKRKDVNKKQGMDAAANEKKQQEQEMQAKHFDVSHLDKYKIDENIPTGNDEKEVYILNMQEKNKELMMKLERAERSLAVGHCEKTHCCTIF